MLNEILTSILYQHHGCHIIRRDAHKILLRVPTELTGDAPWCAKVFLLPTWRCKLSAMHQRLGGPHEWRVAQRLIRSGVPIPEPVGTAEDYKWGKVPVRSLFASLWAASHRSLVDVIRDAMHPRKAAAQRLGPLAEAVGRFIAGLHAKGILNRDLNAGNFLVRENTNTEFDLLLLDYEKVVIKTRLPLARRMKNLGQIGAFFMQTSPVVYQRLIDGYAEASTTPVDSDFRKAVLQLAKHRQTQWEQNRDEKFDRIRRHRQTASAQRTVGAVLNAFVSGSQLPDRMRVTDWDRLDQVVTSHKLGPIFSGMLSSATVPPGLQAKWDSALHTTWREYRLALQDTVKLFRVFAEIQAPATVLRGLAIGRQFYPDPAQRPMTDVDILVAPRSVADIRSRLAQAGIQPVKSLEDRGKYIYIIDHTLFEIHWSFITPKRYRHIREFESWLDLRQKVTLKNGFFYRLPAEQELIGQVVHAFTHHKLNRLLHLVDIALMINQAPINWEYINNWCRQTRLTRVFAFTFGYVSHMLGIQLPDAAPIMRRHRAFEAYASYTCGRDTPRLYLRRATAAMQVAQRPLTRIQQALRFLAFREMVYFFRLVREKQINIRFERDAKRPLTSDDST